MKKEERGAVSVLVLIMAFCFTTILTGAYVTTMILAQTQQKSNIKIQRIYGDDVKEAQNIYEQIQQANEPITVSYYPDGQVQSYSSSEKLQSKISIANVKNENVHIYYSWSENNKEEPITWLQCKNGEEIEKDNVEPGTYYLWSKICDSNNNILKTEVSKEFVISQKEIENENVTYNWKKEHEWGNGKKYDLKYYKILINITNHEKTIENWEIQFDVQPGIVLQNCNVWSASSIEVDGNTVTMKCQSWNAHIKEGQTLVVDFILAFDNTQELSIDNFKFNGKTIKNK